MSEVLHPDEFGRLLGGEQNEGTSGMPISDIADLLYKHEPQFMGRLEAHVRQHGFTDPVVMESASSDALRIGNGQHRAAVAYRTGTPLPYRLPGAPGGSKDWSDKDFARNNLWENDVRSPEESAVRDSIIFGDPPFNR